jgi:error-prone DNA polymerase
MEDETGISNVVIHPQIYEQHRVLVTRGKFLKVYGKLQNQDGVVHVKAVTVELLQSPGIELRSHDFH